MFAHLSQLLPPAPPSDPIPWDFVFGLVLTFTLGQILALFYERHARVGSDRRKLARLFPLIAATTMLVIFVVKSSIALSLGLVGALSIVRFRTPIKEPEELIYLFVAIAIGIGGRRRRDRGDGRFDGRHLAVPLPAREVRGGPAVSPHAPSCAHGTRCGQRRCPDRVPRAARALRAPARRRRVRRVDAEEGSLEMSVLLDLEHAGALAPLMEALETTAPVPR